MLRFSCMQSACVAGGAKRGCGPWSKLGYPAFFFALHHVPKNEMTCAGLKGFQHHETRVCFCFGEEGGNAESRFGLVYASLYSFHG